MPWEENRNRNSLSPHGLKAAEGHGARAIHDLHSVGCPPMPDGILGLPLNARPNDRGEPGRGPVKHEPSSRRPRDEPAAMTPPHDPAPHPYSPAGQKQQANTYGKVPHR
jgi:hypothetical protein